MLEGGDQNAMLGVIEVLGGECCFTANSFIVSGSPSNPMLGGGELNAMLGVTLQYANFATDELIIQALFPGFRSIFPLLSIL